jgi:hypothetical protein
MQAVQNIQNPVNFLTTGLPLNMAKDL